MTLLKYVLIKQTFSKMNRGNRPYLKGKIHLLAAILYLYLSTFILQYVPDNLSTVICTYLFCVIFHFSTSALLHIPIWTEDRLPTIRKIDHIAIYINIVATYWVYINTIIPDVGIYMLSCLYGGTILGILSRILYTDAPNYIIAIPYIMVGWAALFDINCIYNIMDRSPDVFIYSIIGGLCYTSGAIAYIFKYPNLIPGMLEFHELFHLMSTIGTMLLTYTIFFHAISYSEIATL